MNEWRSGWMLFINLTRFLFSFKYLHSFNKYLIGSSKGIVKIFGNASWFLFFYWVNFKVKRIMKKWFLKSLKDFIMEIFKQRIWKNFTVITSLSTTHILANIFCYVSIHLFIPLFIQQFVLIYLWCI